MDMRIMMVPEYHNAIVVESEDIEKNICAIYLATISKVVQRLSPIVMQKVGFHWIISNGRNLTEALWTGIWAFLDPVE